MRSSLTLMERPNSLWFNTCDPFLSSLIKSFKDGLESHYCGGLKEAHMFHCSWLVLFRED